MPALSAIDLAMFMLETPERPLNIGPLVLLRPPLGFKGNFADKLSARMLKRPPGPPFNYRLQLSLTRAPSVEPVDRPDPKRHVHRLSLHNASTQQLLKTVSELHETVLDRSGMLWQFWVIDGLADGGVALYGKVHHGIIDGRSFVRAVTQWLSTDSKDKQVRAMWEGLERTDGGSGQRADKHAGLVRMLLRSGAQATGLLKTAAGLGGLLAGQGLSAAGIGQGTSLPFLNVPDAFDGALSPQRTYAYCTLPLDEMKALGKAHGATVNDLLLTVIDMAMQRYLSQRGKAPSVPLVADMPVALSAGAKGGNQIAVLTFPLGGASASVADRLDAIRAETGKLKASLGKHSSDVVIMYTSLVHALPLLVERVAKKASPRLSNLLISNPFGLESPRYLMGAAVELVLPMSVVVAGHKLNITAVTLADRLQIGFLAMPDAVPHIERLARFTEQAFAELTQALATAPDPVPAEKPAQKVANKTGTTRAAKTPTKAASAKTSPPARARATRRPSPTARKSRPTSKTKA